MKSKLIAIYCLVGLARLPICLFVVSLGFANSAFSKLIAYEGFDYPGYPQIAGQNGGVGFSGGWTGSGQAGAGSLGYFGLLATSGDNLSNPGGRDITNTRMLSSAVTTGTVWLSVLMRPTSTYVAGDTVGLYALGDNSGSRIFVGAGNNSSGLAYGVGSGSLTGNFNFSAAATLPTAGSTVFLVLRLDRIDAINTTVTFYLNPTPGRTLPDVGAVGSYTYNRARPNLISA